eukprot:3166148-Pleurochrysis_carterae.AAC.1
MPRNAFARASTSTQTFSSALALSSHLGVHTFGGLALQGNGVLRVLLMVFMASSLQLGMRRICEFGSKCVAPRGGRFRAERQPAKAGERRNPLRGRKVEGQTAVGVCCSVALRHPSIYYWCPSSDCPKWYTQLLASIRIASSTAIVVKTARGLSFVTAKCSRNGACFVLSDTVAAPL